MRRLSDDELLDFDSRRYSDYRRSDARRTLKEHGDAYRAQLVAAHMLAGYRERRLAQNEKHRSASRRSTWTAGTRRCAT